MMGKSPCCPKEGMNKGAWTAIEDQILKDYIKVHGDGKWGSIPKRAGLKRSGKSCRLRWLNYLRPNIKRGNITQDEDDLIIRLHNLLGNRWSLIAGRLPGRTDNEIKNYWNTNLSKRAKLKQPNNITKPESNVRTKPSNPAPLIPCQVQTKVETSKISALVSPEVHQLPNHYQLRDVNNLETLAPIMPSQPKNDGVESLTSKEEGASSEFMVDYDIGLVSISELLGSDFTGQTFLEHEPNYWGTSSDQFNTAHVDGESLDFWLL